MLLSNGAILQSLQRIALGLALLVGLTACQVRPLYDSSMSEALASVSVSSANDVTEQNIRNELIFLFNQGGAEPRFPNYILTLNVYSSNSAAVYDSSLNANMAGRVTLTGSYSLEQVSDKKVLGKGSQSVTALIDDLNQDFARERAVLDAQKRAGRELAELIKNEVAIILSRQH